MISSYKKFRLNLDRFHWFWFCLSNSVTLKVHQSYGTLWDSRDNQLEVGTLTGGSWWCFYVCKFILFAIWFSDWFVFNIMVGLIKKHPIQVFDNIEEYIEIELNFNLDYTNYQWIRSKIFSYVSCVCVHRKLHIQFNIFLHLPLLFTI